MDQQQKGQRQKEPQQKGPRQSGCAKKTCFHIMEHFISTKTLFLLKRYDITNACMNP